MVHFATPSVLLWNASTSMESLADINPLERPSTHSQCLFVYLTVLESLHVACSMKCLRERFTTISPLYLFYALGCTERKLCWAWRSWREVRWRWGNSWALLRVCFGWNAHGAGGGEVCKKLFIHTLIYEQMLKKSITFFLFRYLFFQI